MCGAWEVQCAHIRAGTFGGMGLKPSDSMCVPLCVKCHSRQHSEGERVFWGVNLEAAKELASALFLRTGDQNEADKLLMRFRQK
jgi:hypothetical protein